MVRVEWHSETAEGVAVITLDRPDRRNAVDHPTILAILEAQEAVGAARAVVLTGAPPAFCAGADLQGVREDVFAADLRRALQGFIDLPCPVIAAIDGPALGAGAQFVAVCDLRVATPGSVVGVPAARLGLVVEQWTIARMVHEFGASIARGMFVGAETYHADQLHAAGVVHRLGDLSVALEWAGQLALLAPLSLAGHKLALEAIAAGRDDDPAVVAARHKAWASADAAEGRLAFLEKRRPRFEGH
jgi:enoyl-CoA hydratase